MVKVYPMPGMEQVLGECNFYDSEKQWPVAEARLSAVTMSQTAGHSPWGASGLSPICLSKQTGLRQALANLGINDECGVRQGWPRPPRTIPNACPVLAVH